uniref:Uncharacterized protein n=1 Tax=Anser cygnoides TaxID=8845 RepID=A0A8B9DX22_ANSCY
HVCSGPTILGAQMGCRSWQNSPQIPHATHTAALLLVEGAAFHTLLQRLRLSGDTPNPPSPQHFQPRRDAGAAEPINPRPVVGQRLQSWDSSIQSLCAAQFC